jgi:hypothetical protein
VLEKVAVTQSEGGGRLERHKKVEQLSSNYPLDGIRNFVLEL